MEENVTFAKEDVAVIDADIAPTAGMKPEGGEHAEEKTQDAQEVKTEETQEAKEAKPEVLEKAPEDPNEKFKDFEEQWSKKFSALSRRERYLSQKEREANDKGRTNESDRKEIEELKKFKSEFETNPYGVMDKAGHTYENWTQKILAGEPTPIPSQTPKELEDIRAELNTIKQERVQQSQVQVQAQRQHTPDHAEAILIIGFKSN